MQEKTVRRSNAARTEETRAKLIAAARAKFIENGYAETSTPEIVKSAGVTRGALYHHFEDKADLLRAVLRAEFQSVAKEINAAAVTTPGDAIDALRLGGAGYLQAMRSPARIRLMLLDGPAVLGRDEVDAIDRETSRDTLRIGLEAAVSAGLLRDLPVQAMTVQISALLDRAALGISIGEDEADHLAVYDAVLDGLRP